MDEDLQPIFPSDELICRNCKFKKNGTIGYKNGHCDIYENGKPNGILFNGDMCSYFEAEDENGPNR